MIKPPPETLNEVFSLIQSKPHKKHISDYMGLHKPLDDKGRYLPFEELRHRLPKHLDAAVCWSIVKSAREDQYSKILPVGEPTVWCNYILTPIAQKTISTVDINATTAALKYMTGKIGEQAHFNYLLSDLVEDEAISSSQLEGASTTTLVAKDMLKRSRKPRTPDEKMIIGNFKLMNFAWEMKAEPLSVELISAMHRVGVDGIDDAKYAPGRFRENDEVVVQDGDGHVVHTPPPAEGIVARLETLSEWINQRHGDGPDADYIHPLVKAIALHFALGYEHPFRDGNGRVARALFYWFMFKNDYGAFRYVSISVLLKKASTQYGHSYLYAETDELDITYFVDYQCSVVMRAVIELKTAYEKSIREAEDFNRWLWDSGLYKQFSEKQKIIFQVAKSGRAKHFTAVNVKENLDCSYNTASAALNGLVELKVFSKKKAGREWVFSMVDKTEIQKVWRTDT
ncbi:Fic family protein [Pseudomonas gingeri]|uniref:Fic family protein n=1 Tax=Pseudomonas gingeri TaxID=117681 RepID=UPI0015A2AE1C|nr:Fic family protein [Pseudomonas gingeri]NWA23627.1 Fic family protein [Pseudomonas gingeri]NWD68273.1 Fic family protein [Pseudomonas gingeri]